MLEPVLSPFRWVMQRLGIVSASQIWRQENLSLMIGLMVFVGGVGSWIIIQYGSLKSISHEILEAARIDGATSTQIALRIKLPLIKKYIAYMGIVLLGSTLQIFTEPDLLNSTIYQGIASSWSLNQISYTLAFSNGEFPLASALSILMIVPTIIIAVIVIVKNDFLNEQG
jgi:multiple sugar transport system permease protein